MPGVLCGEVVLPMGLLVCNKGMDKTSCQVVGNWMDKNDLVVSFSRFFGSSSENVGLF